MSMRDLTPDEEKRLAEALGMHPAQAANGPRTANDVLEGSAHDQLLVETLVATRQCLRRWAARYAQSDHARQHVKETNLLIQQIDEIMLNL